MHEQHDIIYTFPAVWLLWALHNKFEKIEMYVNMHTNGLIIHTFLHIGSYNDISIETITLQLS